MLLALRFNAESGNPFCRVGYNSLGAYATINHLHFQACLCVGGCVRRSCCVEISEKGLQASVVRIVLFKLRSTVDMDVCVCYRFPPRCIFRLLSL